MEVGKGGRINTGAFDRAIDRLGDVGMRLVVAGLAERVAQPLETLVETVSGCGAG